MSEPESCREAKAARDDARSELAEAEETYNRSLVVVFDARKALEAAQEEVNAASHRGGVAESAVADAEKSLNNQKWSPEYLGRERDIEQKEEQLAEAQEAFRRANDETTRAVEVSNAAKSAFDNAQAELDKYKREFDSATERHGNWEQRVREVCQE